MEIICHIVGLTNSSKQQFLKKMADMNYNIVDLDELSNAILQNNMMTQLFKQYQTFKNSKNDKFKDIDKKMTMYWETSMEENILERLDKHRKNIIIGYNHHFRNINKHIKFPVSKPVGRFILKVTKSDVKCIITFNLDKHKEDIIRGAYPLNNIDFDLIYTNRQKIDSVYEKNNYLPKTLDTLYTILELGSIDKDKSICLWIASTQPYNIGSKMYPSKNDKLFAFTDQIMALLSSFRFSEDELEKTFDNNIIKVKPKKAGVLEKMRGKRYLYLVDKTSFIPHEKGNNVKFFSQEPVIILEMIKISNVYQEYFADK
jgi:hypothetical protein